MPAALTELLCQALARNTGATHHATVLPTTNRALPTEENVDWVLATSNYGEDFVAAVCKGAAMATQFHPEKSGTTGACWFVM